MDIISKAAADEALAEAQLKSQHYVSNEAGKIDPATLQAGDTWLNTDANKEMVVFDSMWIEKPTAAVSLKEVYSKAENIASLALKEDITANDTKLGFKADITYVDAKPTGQKNLVINGRKTIQQRVLTGGTKQVIEATMNVGGEYTLSYYGGSGVTIYEFPALLADYATTIADSGTNVIQSFTGTLGTAVPRVATVTATPGYYIAIQFASTDFTNVQLEQGSLPTNLEIRHNELQLCLSFYNNIGSIGSGCKAKTTTSEFYLDMPIQRAQPIVIYTAAYIYTRLSTLLATNLRRHHTLANIFYMDTLDVGLLAAGEGGGVSITGLELDAEIFNTTATYKEDRWFI